MVYPVEQAILLGISVFSIVNPFAAIPVFVGLTATMPRHDRMVIKRTSSFATFVILVAAYLVGESLLRFFGISIASLRVAGGVLIFSMAWSMLQAKMPSTKQTPEEAEEAGDRKALAIVPLAMPLLAGPGAISVMILAATKTDGLPDHLGAMAATAVVCVVIFLTLLLSAPIAKILGQTGMNVGTRFMGLILAAVAVEFVTGGLSEIFPAWTIPTVGG